jgi:hypothetical protein
MSKKQWYEVTLEQNKTIKVYAEDADEAQEKAEVKMGATWCAISAWVAS